MKPLCRAACVRLLAPAPPTTAAGLHRRLKARAALERLQQRAATESRGESAADAVRAERDAR
jgi:hypothetical protein